jgi:hypothetical protein
LQTFILLSFKGHRPFNPASFFLPKERSKENGIFARSAKIAILSASLSL